MSTSLTPSDVAIEPRQPAFDLRGALGTDWNGGDPFKTAFFNALSLTFPIGEKYFIDSVRGFEKELADSKLKREVRGFIGQEAVHRREHRKYNEMLCAARAYDDATFQRDLQARIDDRDDLSRFTRLLETVTFEHLTAILAHGLLTDERWLGDADKTMAQLWRWHAIEEAEHKAVAFDVYRAAGGDMERLRLALPLVTKQMLTDILQGTWMMLKTDGRHLDPSVWARGLNWLFGPNGVMWSLKGQWRAFRQDGFHPWNHDNRDVISDWKAAGEPELLAA